MLSSQWVVDDAKVRCVKGLSLQGSAVLYSALGG